MIYFTSNDGSQNTLRHQPILDDYVRSRKSNGVYNSKRKPLYITFLHSIKLSEHRKESLIKIL